MAPLLVFPSLWYETMGGRVRSTVARVPAIVSRMKGARDLIQDGVNGLVSIRGQIRLLRCLNVLADDSQAEAMGKNAYELYWRNPPSSTRTLIAF